MTIGEKIRDLRLKNHWTQEKLAELLCISFQAVSKWETGCSTPDISMIAPLCNLFCISADELLGIQSRNKAAEVSRYSDAYCQWSSAVRKTDESRRHTISVLREGLRLHPDSRLLKRQLVTVLFSNSTLLDDLEEKRELCRLCSELIEDTEDIYEKSRYISMYCSHACITGNAEQGKIYANMLPDENLDISRMLAYALCCEGAERKQKLYDYILKGWGILRTAMLQFITETDASANEILALREKQEQIYAILFDNDDVVQYVDFDEIKIAKAFYLAGDFERAMQYAMLCFDKWTSKQQIKNISPLRNQKEENYYSLTDAEIRANAEDFMLLVQYRVPELLKHDAIRQILSEI